MLAWNLLNIKWCYWRWVVSLTITMRLLLHLKVLVWLEWKQWLGSSAMWLRATHSDLRPLNRYWSFTCIEEGRKLSFHCVSPVSSVWGIDNDLGAATHVRRTVSLCFAALCQLHHLRRSVTDDCFRSLVVSLVHFRLDYGNFVLVGLPAYLQRQLQSILNAAARLVFRLRRYDHVTDALAILHWLRLPQWVDFKVAVMVFRVLHGLAPPYLNQLVCISELPGRHRLRSLLSPQLLVPPFWLTTVGRRSFPVAASFLWNSLPTDIQSSPSLPVFCQRLKTFLFRQSFSDVVLWLYYASVDFIIVLLF